MNLNTIERIKLQAESGCAANTIRCYPNVQPISQHRIEEAAKRLGLFDKLIGVATSVEMRNR